MAVVLFSSSYCFVGMLVSVMIIAVIFHVSTPIANPDAESSSSKGKIVPVFY
jgi:hypothetical protein